MDLSLSAALRGFACLLISLSGLSVEVEPHLTQVCCLASLRFLFSSGVPVDAGCEPTQILCVLVAAGSQGSSRRKPPPALLQLMV